jgi:hypothetical protein
VLNRCSQPDPAAQLLALGHDLAAGASSGPDAPPSLPSPPARSAGWASCHTQHPRS